MVPPSTCQKGPQRDGTRKDEKLESPCPVFGSRIDPPSPCHDEADAEQESEDQVNACEGEEDRGSHEVSIVLSIAVGSDKEIRVVRGSADRWSARAFNA